MKKNNNTYLLMTLAALFWAGAFIAGKMVVGELNPISLTTLRFVLSTIFIGILNFIFKENSKRITGKDIISIILLSLVGVLGYQVLFLTSLNFTSASNASIVVSFSPLITVFLASIFLNERLNVKRILIVIVGMIGVVLTISNGDINTIMKLKFNIGNLTMFLAAICLAIYSVFSKSMIKKYSPITITTYTLIISTIVLLPVSIKMGLIEEVSDMSIRGWISVSYMSIFATVLAYMIQQKSIKEIGPGTTEMFRNLVPVFSILLSVIILKEKIGLINIISGVVILIAVYLNSTIRKEDNEYEVNKVSEEAKYVRSEL